MRLFGTLRSIARMFWPWRDQVEFGADLAAFAKFVVFVALPAFAGLCALLLILL